MKAFKGVHAVTTPLDVSPERRKELYEPTLNPALTPAEVRPSNSKDNGPGPEPYDYDPFKQRPRTSYVGWSPGHVRNVARADNAVHHFIETRAESRAANRRSPSRGGSRAGSRGGSPGGGGSHGGQSTSPLTVGQSSMASSEVEGAFGMFPGGEMDGADSVR